ncbi:hypothetical protein HF086_008522 [Spodoptera exigua]|uniref:Uncharacterized protein n=1 Tax=Spodoptera exigua TaxID=7107 RepID=A0A922S9Q8_SPOEX|nr:hypothetical protein HF086_008522 [Spodoptera exigua]
MFVGLAVIAAVRPLFKEWLDSALSRAKGTGKPFLFLRSSFAHKDWGGPREGAIMYHPPFLRTPDVRGRAAEHFLEDTARQCSSQAGHYTTTIHLTTSLLCPPNY